jgi:hypothetical protein
VMRAAAVASSSLSKSESAVRSTTVGAFLLSLCLSVTITLQDKKEQDFGHYTCK